MSCLVERAKRSNFQNQDGIYFPGPDLAPEPFQLGTLILGGANAVNEFFDHGQTPASGMVSPPCFPPLWILKIPISKRY